MKRKKVKELIREIVDLDEKMLELNEELDLLEDRSSEIGRELYENRSKEFIKGVVFCLGELKDDFNDSSGYEDLKERIETWLNNYDDVIDKRLKITEKYTPEELLMYKEKVEG